MAKFLFLLSIILLTLNINLTARVFEAEGADLLLGVGSEEIAKGGAVVSSTNDAYAVFWNPAGLSEIKENEFIISKTVNGSLIDINYLAIAKTLYFDDQDLKLTLAFAYIPKIYIKTRGKFYDHEPASIFSLYTLPELSGNYDGKIDSVTDDYRFAMAISPIQNPKWSVGLSLGHISCGTTFAGYTMEDPNNYTVNETTAEVLSLGAGFKIFINDNWTFAGNARNINGQLDVEIIETNDNGKQVDNYVVPIPNDITLAANWQNEDKNKQFAVDYQRIYGTYGNFDLDFQFLRTSYTLYNRDIRYHMGFILPVKMQSNKLEDIKLPIPVLPSTGLGWEYEDITLALSIYAHPIASYTNEKVELFSDFSIKYSF